jgi:hypothetical protein
MGDAGSKTLKITASTDGAAFAKALAAVRELTREIEKLAAASAKVNLGGGGGMGVKISGVAGQPGNSTISQMGAKMGSGGGSGGVAGNLAQAVVQSTALMKVAAAGQKDAFKGMSDGLKALVQNSNREISSLTNNLVKLEAAYRRIGSGGGGGGRRYIDVQPLAIGPSGGGSGGGNVFNGYSGPYIPPTGGGGGGSYIANRMGGAGSGPPGGGFTRGQIGVGVTAALALANFGISASYENKAATLQYGICLAGQTLNRQATYGQIYGGNAVRLAGGDIALSAAMNAAARDRDFKEATALKVAQDRVAFTKLTNPNDLLGATYKGGLPNPLNLLSGQPIGGGAQTFIKSGVGNIINNGAVSADRRAAFAARMRSTPMRFGSEAGIGGAGQATFGGGPGVSAGGLTTLDIAQKTAMDQLPEEMASRNQAALEAVLQRNPLLNSQMSQYYGGALGDLNLARMGRTGGGLIRDPRTGLYTGDAVQNFKERAISAGWDPGQVAGMTQSIGHQVGWAARGVGSMSMLSKQMGGFGSALNVAAMGNQFGGNGGGLVNAIAGRGGMVGRGGLDITAGSNIFGMGAGMMASGNFAGSGLGLMQTLGAAGFTGTSGGDMLQARAMGAGMGAMDAMMGGNIDPLSKGLNASAAMKAAPNAPYATHAALMSLDSGTMMTALKSGSVPPELMKQGVTLEILKKYVAAQNGTAFARYSETMGAGTEVGSAIERYKKSGGSLGYMKSWSLKRKQDELNTIGLGMKLAGIAPTMEAGVSRARIQAATEGVLTAPKGRGAFAVGAGAQRRAALKAQGRIEGMSGEGIANAENEGGLFTGAATNMPKSIVELEKQRVAAQAGASDTRGAGGVEGAINSIDAAFRTFVAALRGDPQILGKKMGVPQNARAPIGSSR